MTADAPQDTPIPAAHPARKSQPCYNYNSLLSVNNISMRFGARILFEDVTLHVLRRAALRHHRAERRGKIHADEDSYRRDRALQRHGRRGPKKLGVLSQDQFAFDEFRVIDTVIMGNAPLWKALRGARRALRQAARAAHRRGRHAPGRARRNRRRRRRLHRGSRRGDACSTDSTWKNRCTSAR